jgi:hypothetical protein
MANMNLRNAPAHHGRRTKFLRIGVGASLLLGLSGCGAIFNEQNDPLVRQGLFEPSHTNHQNLVLQVANPGDLVRGSGTTGGDGQLAAAAVDRLRNDKVKRLPASDVAQIVAGNSGDNNSSGGGGQ